MVGHHVAAPGGEMSMIRLGDRNTSRGIPSPRTGTAPGRGAECREPILGALQLEGEIFSLDIPSHRTIGWADFFGSPNDFEYPPVVNGAPKRRRSLVEEQSTHVVVGWHGSY